MKLHWKKQDKEKGLARVLARPRGYYYHNGVIEYALVSPLIEGYRTVIGWYWVALTREGIPYKNTCRNPCATVEEAKKQAQEYIKKYLANPLKGD